MRPADDHPAVGDQLRRAVVAHFQDEVDASGAEIVRYDHRLPGAAGVRDLDVARVAGRLPVEEPVEAQRVAVGVVRTRRVELDPLAGASAAGPSSISRVEPHHRVAEEATLPGGLEIPVLDQLR
jgi:hypothetical protein